MGELTRKLELPETSGAVLLLVLSVCCALLLLTLERHLAPRDLPSLRLPRDAVRAVMEQDAARAARAPTGKLALELDAMLLDHGVAEHDGSEDLDKYKRRKKALREGYAKIVQQQGERAALALRARAVQRLESALELQLPQEQVAGVMGSFANTLQKNEATREGEIVAPRFVVRTLYKARWNLLHQLAPTHGFERVEKLAYFGWLCLHARRAPLTRRIAALQPYADAGGERVEEAAGVLLFAAKQYGGAAEVLTRAHELRGGVRIRNYTLGARWAAGFED